MLFFRKKKGTEPGLDVLDLQSVSGEENATRDRQLSELLSSICTDAFPDDEHNTWSLLKTLHVGARTYAWVEPHPKDVGYDRFVFVFQFNEDDADFVTLVVYGYEGEGYSLLSTTPNCYESFPKILTW